MRRSVTSSMHWQHHFDTSNVAKEQSVEVNLETLDWVQLGATLQRLHLRGLQAHDEAMEIFLKLPCLTHLLIERFSLDESFAGRPCTWEELVILCAQMDMQTLASLPLHSGLLLKIGDEESCTAPCEFYMDTDTLELLLQAATAVKQTKGVEWHERRVKWKLLSDMEAVDLARGLALALPLVKNVSYLEIEQGELNDAAFQALCELVNGREDEPTIEFNSQTQWEVEGMKSLVMCMPHNGTITLSVDDADGEQQIIELCCAAQRKLSLHVQYNNKDDMCEHRIRSAVQAHDIEVLELTLYNHSLDVTVQPCHDSFVLGHIPQVA